MEEFSGTIEEALSWLHDDGLCTEGRPAHNFCRAASCAHPTMAIHATSKGSGLLIFQLMLFPSLAKMFGPILLIRATAVISIPVLIIYPFIAMLKGTQLWIAINFASLIKNILAIMTITGTHILLNNAVDDDRRATANGLQMSAMSLFKAIGPTGAGIVFSWSQKRQHANFFPGFHMVCLFLNIVVIIFVFMTMDPILPRSTNKPIANDQRDSLHEEERHTEEQEKHAFS